MARARPLPRFAIVVDRFQYHPDTGKIFHRRDLPNGVKSGQEAGIFGKNGYLRLKIDGRDLLAHRVAWLLFYGDDPHEMYIDHINGNKSDNRISNLRLATIEQNGWNRGKAPTNKSGFKGVSKNCGKWEAHIRIGKERPLRLGRFKNAEDAHRAYAEAAQKFHGEFAKCE